MGEETSFAEREVRRFADSRRGGNPLDLVYDAVELLGDGSKVESIIYVAGLAGLSVEEACECLRMWIDLGVFREGLRGSICWTEAVRGVGRAGGPPGGRSGRGSRGKGLGLGRAGVSDRPPRFPLSGRR